MSHAGGKREWIKQLAYLYHELQEVPPPANTLCVSPGFMEKVLPTGILKCLSEPASPNQEGYVSLLGVRILELDCLPEWCLVWTRGTEMVQVIDLRRAVDTVPA